MEKFQITCLQILEGSKAGYLYFVCVGSVSSVKVEPKCCQLPILVILAASLVLNT